MERNRPHQRFIKTVKSTSGRKATKKINEVKTKIKAFTKQNPTTSQRQIAAKYNISLGIVNKILKEMHIKVNLVDYFI